jgi:hypothetical protein
LTYKFARTKEVGGLVWCPGTDNLRIAYPIVVWSLFCFFTCETWQAKGEKAFDHADAYGSDAAASGGVGPE